MNIIYESRKEVLDYGYVEFIERWGSDERIIEAARMSTGKGFLGWEPEVNYICPKCGYTRVENVAIDRKLPCPNQCLDNASMPYKLVHHGDEKLLRYLYTNKHYTPFEMAGMVIDVKAPIFVFREWHRHRTQSYNEMSARYTPLPNENYFPSVNRCMDVSGTNKQAGAIPDSGQLTHEAVLDWLGNLDTVYRLAESVYQQGLAIGIPKEVARLPVPVARYSKMRASANLRNWLAFLTLRMDEHAQWEIRQFANAVGKLIEFQYPKTWELFVGR